MTHVPYLVAGYSVTFSVLGAYAGWMLHRRRVLASTQAALAERPERRR